MIEFNPSLPSMGNGTHVYLQLILVQSVVPLSVASWVILDRWIIAISMEPDARL
jgi:hypothetical protein